MDADFKEFPEGVAVVIAGSGFVGREVCRRLAECGSDVALTYHANSAAAAEAAKDVVTRGRKAEIAQLDITDTEAVKTLFDNVAERWGRIHSVIVAAGANIRLAYFSEIGPDEWLDAVHTDLFGFFNIAKAALPHLRAHGGSITGVTTAANAYYSPKDILSTAPKSGVEAVIKAIAREEGRAGIRANSVGIGVLDGGITGRFWPTLSTEFQDSMRTGNPLRRMGHPREIGDVIVFLASNRASYVTGQRLIVDGGYSV